MVKVKFLGHACFLIEGEKETILVDPFLTGNPLGAADPEQLKPDYIFLTHGHGDHLGDAIKVAKQSGAEVMGVFELMNYIQNQGVENVHPAHMGGKIKYSFGWVKLVPAFHSSSAPDGTYTGNPVGFVINYHGHHIYHAGDTGIFGDMELIGRFHKVDTALLPIGGTFTMDVEEAVEATRMLKCRMVIPMHYNTFPPVEADAQEFKTMVESKTQAMCIILKPGETTELT
ncbi:MAG: metal-dependent hydrolase [Vulcanimicrobiota bacterium]